MRSLQDEVIEDIEKRKEIGLKNYGKLLYTKNGRSMLVDAYEEALDLCCYLKGAIIEEQEEQLANLKSTDKFYITGRGDVFTFSQFPYGFRRSDLLGREVNIDGDWYIITGIEQAATIGTAYDYVKGPVGILVKEIER